MPKATIYYVDLTEPQRAELNAKGWNSLIGKAYLDARVGKIDSTNFDLLTKAATFEFADSAEAIWIALQNGAEPWTTLTYITCHTMFPRSMDVGDIIVWEDGKRERCAPVGFKPIEV